MGGALLNLVAYGNLNVIINGNPTKTFFKTTYAKYTNFGLQKHRINFNGQGSLQLNTHSSYEFDIKRYGDLFLDHYLVIKLPKIWSPILTLDVSSTISPTRKLRVPYEFKWIKNLGSQLIKKITYYIGGQIIQEFTGQYIHNMVQRDFSREKRDLFNEMIGNVPELNDPANYLNRNGNYPNSWFYPNLNSEPSIPGRTLYIPLNLWSTLSSKMPIPLVSLQCVEMSIKIECRPISQLYVIRNVLDSNLTNPSIINQRLPPYKPAYISPTNADANALGSTLFHFFRFVNPPPAEELNGINDDYPDTQQGPPFNDIHMVATYAVLSEEERVVFAAKPQKYLVREVYEERYENVTTSHNTELRNSQGLVSSWMWFFQRSDVNLRNEWSNYTNWPYDYIPYSLTNLDPSNIDLQESLYPKSWCHPPPCLCDGSFCHAPLTITGPYHPDNQKYIMTKWGLLLGASGYREEEFDAGVWNLAEKYVGTAGNAELGLYCYNFCLNTDPFNFQPNGALNCSKFSRISFVYDTIAPPLDPQAKTYVICDNEGMPIGVNKPSWNIYKYNYSLYVMEERYNILVIESGFGSLKFAR